MPPTEIIDLDQLLGKPKKVKLAGKVYTLPAQIPVPLYLLTRQRNKEREDRIEKGEETDDEDVVTEIHSQVLELFQIHHPDLKELPVGIGQLFQVIPTIYPPRGVIAGDGDDAAPPTNPTTRARRGSKNSTPARKARKATKPR